MLLRSLLFSRTSSAFLYLLYINWEIFFYFVRVFSLFITFLTCLVNSTQKIPPIYSVFFLYILSIQRLSLWKKYLVNIISLIGFPANVDSN